ncbi:MAG: glycoside hydrolase family 127 protein [Planctomycetota bacterium]
MRVSIAVVLSSSLLSLIRAQGPPRADLREVPFPQVVVRDPFFAPRRKTNREVTLRHALDQLEKTGTLGNFDLAAHGKREGFRGYVFQDSDAYKAVEAVAFALADGRDEDLEARLDAVIARIAAAQRPDGYLDTWFLVNAPEKRFSNLRDQHELYCAGHLIEAAVAHARATGKSSLLGVARRYADLLCETFGEGGREGYPGHPEIELALVKLADLTGEKRYFDLARTFVRRRGAGFFAKEHSVDPARYDGSYWIDHSPICDLEAIAGHAVRATYLMSGAVDVGARAGDEDLLRMTRRVWRNTHERNTFVTGGIGPSASNEGFTRDYDLPTRTCYQESCASIAMAMWAHRMNLLYGDGRYADAMETALYNAIPAGVQLDGTRFFYVNPLESPGDHHREEWFGCACCPPNLARTFAAIGSYAYASGPDSLWINLFVRGSVRCALNGTDFELAVDTDYPWDGAVRFVVASEQPVRGRLCFRIPSWSTRNRFGVNGEELAIRPVRGYCSVDREWRKGDLVELLLDMSVQRVEADPRADALRGQVAFRRGPVVYCAEQVDNDAPLSEVFVPPGGDVASFHDPGLLGGVTVLSVEAMRRRDGTWPKHALYRSQAPADRLRLSLIPYAVWDHREPGAMRVFFPEAPPPPVVRTPESEARIELSFRNWNCDPEGLRDGEEPRRSGDTPPRNCHFWNHRGTTEWAQYTWMEPRTFEGIEVYWFDDRGHGECRLPASARVLWLDGEQWKPVEAVGPPLPIALDRWCRLRFAPVTTKALRLQVDMQQGWSAGILEWRVREREEDR